MNHEYPTTLLENDHARITAISDELVILYWHGTEVGRFGTFIAAVRYLNHEILIG